MTGHVESSESRIARLRRELRTPLELIAASADTLARTGSADAAAAALERIRTAAAAGRHAADEALAALASALAAVPTPAGPTPVIAEEPSAGVPTLCDDGGGARVLVIDADSAGRTMLSQQLRWRGFASDAVADPPTALERIAKQPYAVVILALDMPARASCSCASARGGRLPSCRLSSRRPKTPRPRISSRR